MINRDIVEEMQKLWPEEWDQTSRNRFRKSSDMQYGFSYFYYLTYRRELQLGLNKGKFEYFDGGKAGAQLVRMIWEDEIDTDGDGRLNKNELLSLAALISGDSPKPGYMLQLEDCLIGINRTKEEVRRTEGWSEATANATRRLRRSDDENNVCPASLQEKTLLLVASLLAQQEQCTTSL